MTTTPQSPSAHRQHLLAAFSPKTIEAFEGLIDDRLGLVIGDSDGLVAQLRDVLKEARVSDDPAAKKTASRAVQPVKEAAAATKVAAASGDIRDIADAAEKVAVAKPLVDEAQAAVNAAVERHEAILKPLNPDDLLDLAKRPGPASTTSRRVSRPRQWPRLRRSQSPGAATRARRSLCGGSRCCS